MPSRYEDKGVHRGYPWLPMAMMSIVISLTSLVLYHSYSLSDRMVEHYTPLVDAAMEIKLETTTAHLWLEEVLSNDRDLAIDSVYQHMAQAAWYVRAMLEGGENEEGRFIPLDDPLLRNNIENVGDRLRVFSRLIDERWQQREKAGAGSHLDQHFDAAFAALIAEVDHVETRLQRLIEMAMEHFRYLMLALLTMIGAMGLVAFYTMYRYGRVRQQQLEAVHGANRELRAEMEVRKKYEALLAEQATTDMLTGLYNRRYLANLLEHELALSQRNGTPFSVMLFDIDHFKRVNDQFGHDVGDKVLKEAARRGGEVVRGSDVYGRWGGEEFLVLLPGTPLGGAMELAERFRHCFAEVRFEGAGTVTASFGVAEYRPDESVHGLLQRVDAALYRAKHQGRNRVTAAPSDS